MKTETAAILEILTDKIGQAKKKTLIPDGFAFVGDEGQIQISLSRWRENGRTLTEEGRSELDAETQASREIIALAESIGFAVEVDGYGDGCNGPITSYRLVR